MYKISSRDYISRFDYENSSALLLNGASIKDINGNDAVLTLPIPGEEGSISYDKNITIGSDY